MTSLMPQVLATTVLHSGENLPDTTILEWRGLAVKGLNVEVVLEAGNEKTLAAICTLLPLMYLAPKTSQWNSPRGPMPPMRLRTQRWRAAPAEPRPGGDTSRTRMAAGALQHSDSVNPKSRKKKEWSESLASTLAESTGAAAIVAPAHPSQLISTRPTALACISSGIFIGVFQRFQRIQCAQGGEEAVLADRQLLLNNLQPHYEIWEYCQKTSKAQAQVLRILG